MISTPRQLPPGALAPPVSQPADFLEVTSMSCQHATQNDRLLAYLKRHKYITRAPAFFKLGIANLWARAAELREQGHRIEGRRVTTRGGARVMQYWLIEGRKRAA